MRTAVGILVLDEPRDINPTFRATLEHTPALQTVTEADLSGDGAPETAVALVFLDEARLDDGASRISGLKERWPALRVVVAAQALRADDLRALITAGADALVARSAPARELCAAVLALAWNAESLLTPPAAEAPRPEANDGLGLTPREAEVLRFLSAGFSNKEVARRLTLSVRTVETHRLNLRRKTQTGRLKDLVTLARQLGLAPVLENEPSRRTGEGEGEHGRPARH